MRTTSFLAKDGNVARAAGLQTDIMPWSIPVDWEMWRTGSFLGSCGICN